MNKSYESVKEFHEAFSHPVSEKPKRVETSRGLARTIWTGEELVEFLYESTGSNEEFLDVYSDFIAGLDKVRDKVLAKDKEPVSDVDVTVNQADALVDAMYFLLGTFVELGVKPEPLFNAVHEANMSKLFTLPDGTKEARYREDGKILKSPDFVAPEEEIKKEVEKQINGGE